jgi:hypothetical protein
MTEYTFGYISSSGSCGYNNLQYIILQPINEQLVTYTIIIPKTKENDEIILPTMATNKTIIIDQKNIEPYPTMAINISGRNVHSKKYYYENVKVIVQGECTVSSQNRIDVDR